MQRSSKVIAIIALFSILVSGCVGNNLIGRSELVEINGLRQEFTIQDYNLTVETSAKIVGEEPNRKIIVTGNVTNPGNNYFPYLTFNTLFFNHNGITVIEKPVVNDNVYLLGPNGTKSFEMEYEEHDIEPFTRLSIFDSIKKYKIEVYYP